MDKFYHIYYCSDENGLELMKHSIDSIGTNCTNKYMIHCLISASKESINQMRKMFINFSNLNVKVYDCSNLMDDKFTNYGTVAYLKHISKATMMRMYVNKIVDLTNIDKILYLDNDIYINKDIADLFETDLNGCYLGAVRDTFVNWSRSFPYRNEPFYLRRICDNTYFNGGVELLNVQQMLKDDMFTKLQNYELKPYMKLTDQDIYNALFEGHVKYLDLKYNCKWWMNFNKDDMSIIHAAGHKNQLIYLKLLSVNLYKGNHSHKMFSYYDQLNKNADSIVPSTDIINTYNVYYCADENNIDLMKLSITSLKKNSLPSNKYIIHCLTYGLNFNRTSSLYDLNGDNIVIVVYNCTKLLDEVGNYNEFVNPKKTISKTSLLKMYVDKVINLNNIDKLLYLDTDVYVNKDLEDIFSTNLDGKYIAAVRDINVLWSGAWDKTKYYDKYRKNSNYFNNGVELLNVNEMLKDNVFYELQMYPFNNSKYELADQDLYNELMGKKVEYLDLNYNYNWWLSKWNMKDIHLLHFSGCGLKKMLYMNQLLNGSENISNECNMKLKSFDFNYYNNKNLSLKTKKGGF